MLSKTQRVVTGLVMYIPKTKEQKL